MTFVRIPHYSAPNITFPCLTINKQSALQWSMSFCPVSLWPAIMQDLWLNIKHCALYIWVLNMILCKFPTISCSSNQTVVVLVSKYILSDLYYQNLLLQFLRNNFIILCLSRISWLILFSDCFSPLNLLTGIFNPVCMCGFINLSVR